jgi:hypothetical protein
MLINTDMSKEQFKRNIYDLISTLKYKTFMNILLEIHFSKIICMDGSHIVKDVK